MIYNLPAKTRKVNRLGEIAAVFVKYQVISATRGIFILNPIALFSRLVDHAGSRSKRNSRAELLRKIVEDLGTTYIKFGQWLSVRPDFVPPEIIKELEKLQDRLSPVSYDLIQRTIQEETGRTIDQIFLRFDRAPISTASIAQVHRAVLKTGEEVAVKVQHRDLAGRIKTDLDILRSMAEWAEEKWPHLSLHRMGSAIDAFEATLMDEINFLVEAGNQERMKELFRDTPWVHVPRVYWEHTTERLLVMQFLTGLKISEEHRFPEWGLDRKILATRLSDSMFRQIFEFAFFQSDPHPGNVLFMEDNHIGYVDFGIIEKFDRILRNKLLDWIYGTIYGDVDLFAQTFLDVSKQLAPVDKIQFRNDCMDYLDEARFPRADRISFARLLAISNRLQYRHKVSSPPTFVSIFKTISTLEGLARRVDTNFDWREEWGPKLKKLMERRYCPEAVHSKYWRMIREYDRLVVNFPDDFRDVVRTITEGKFEANMYLPQLDAYVKRVERSLNQLSIAVVLGAIIFGLFFLRKNVGQVISEMYRDHFWQFVLLLAIGIIGARLFIRFTRIRDSKGTKP
jgi:ubiquinone biosynthesis protein